MSISNAGNVVKPIQEFKINPLFLLHSPAPFPNQDKPVETSSVPMFSNPGHSRHKKEPSKKQKTKTVQEEAATQKISWVKRKSKVTVTFSEDP